MSRRELAAPLALAAIIAVTAAWWALALWPLPASTPDWLQRARLVCFGSTIDTLPSAAGWLLLIGEPIAMLLALAVISGTELRNGLRALARTLPGRAVLAAGALFVLIGLGATGVRVAAASQVDWFDPSAGPAGVAEALNEPAPPLQLSDQHGDTVSLAQFTGRPVVVAFAYAHCTTVCPIIVHEMTAMQRQLASRPPALLIITLDPWRDTPARLPAMAASWDLGPHARVLSGSVEDVNRTLDAWSVPRGRDAATGDITHPTFVYIVGRDGRLAYRVPGSADAVTPILQHLP
jgi:cytochrome oxidase Cu insertion factor (SCO1/SenC/PrrC family)